MGWLKIRALARDFSVGRSVKFYHCSMVELSLDMEAQQLTCYDKAVFQHFYSKLVNILPMDDATFMAELYKSGLLPGDLKSLISVQDTQKKKTAYFLDNAIKPSITSDVGTSFSKLLTVMERSEYENVQDLAKQIKIRLTCG